MLYLPRLLRGIGLTLEAMGLGIVVREGLRRLLGIGYDCNGVPINSNQDFKFITKLKILGFTVEGSGDEVVVETPFGKFGVALEDLNLFRVLTEPFGDMYGSVDVKDSIVLDLGAYLGETALFFISKGASRVHAFEPLPKHHQYLLRNISRNSAVGRIIPYDVGIWYRDGVLDIEYIGPGSGSRAASERNSVTIKVRRLDSILSEIFEKEGRIDLVKMDCEGGEYSLLLTSDEGIRLGEQYLIEIHGPETPIVHRMVECGYRAERVMVLSNYLTIYHFSRR